MAMLLPHSSFFRSCPHCPMLAFLTASQDGNGREQRMDRASLPSGCVCQLGGRLGPALPRWDIGAELHTRPGTPILWVYQELPASDHPKKIIRIQKAAYCIGNDQVVRLPHRSFDAAHRLANWLYRVGTKPRFCTTQKVVYLGRNQLGELCVIRRLTRVARSGRIPAPEPVGQHIWELLEVRLYGD
ncbi:hypothetical protein LZ30DRAFT_79188 [Colletotrichum cereale]|nr:hypothetical protein LZ30DRAFT_79188 [Colletotrichum cereale]